MCGIAGIFFPAKGDFSRGATSVQSMLNSIRHRGPDDEGIWSSPDGRVVLGHRRLSILDLSPNGHQPMIGDGGNVIVYNGELYNFHELRKRFVNVPFRSTSDTEVLLKCFEANQAQCLPDLNGMFAFAIWDPNRKRLTLARDRVGIKPLYYTNLGGVFAFASEIKALLTLPWVSPELDENALSSFLTFNHLRAPETMFKGIFKFHPGYLMEIGPDGTQQYRPFWTLRGNGEAGDNHEELAATLREKLTDSVRRQMVADVPVGVFLSGGVDSSGIVALASQQTSVPLTTYSVGFEGAPGYDELEFARKISKQFKTNHIERIVKRQEIADFLPRIVDIYDEPLADATSIPINFISELARENGTVAVLTGDGADELFCGYRRWASYVKALPWYRGLLKAPGWTRNLLKSGYSRFDNTSPKFEFLNQLACGHEVYWGAGGFKASALASILSPEYLSRIADRHPYDEIRSLRKSYLESFGSRAKTRDVNWLCYWGFVEAVPNLYCYRADRMGMAHSIEIRVPFLDNEIVDYAFSLPQESKLHNGVPKAILKKSLEPLLSKEILYRRKMGFCVPIREWGGDIFVDYIEKHLKAFCSDTGLFREEGVRNLLHVSKQGNSDQAFGLWNLYFLMSWMNKWVLRRAQG